MKKMLAWLRIIRPPIVFISCFGALVGAFNAIIYLNNGTIALSLSQIVLFLLGAASLASGLMIHNDVTDLKSDSVNRPNKPLPAGKIGIKTAQLIGLSLMVFSIFVALLINYWETQELNWPCGILTIFIVILGIIYNYFGKYHGIFGHVAVAFGVGAIPFWGAISVAPQRIFLMAPLAIAIFIMEIGREIMVNAGDFKGDLEAGYKTLPVQLGRKKAMYIAIIFYLAFLFIYPIPYFGWFGADPIFGLSYLIGATLFGISLILTWILTYRIVIKNDEERIWDAFEKYERTGTRIMVIFFQIMLFVEVFY